MVKDWELPALPTSLPPNCHIIAIMLNRVFSTLPQPATVLGASASSSHQILCRCFIPFFLFPYGL